MGSIYHRLLTGLSTLKADDIRYVDEEVVMTASDTMTWSWARSQSPPTVIFLPKRMEVPSLILTKPRNDPPLRPTLKPGRI